MTAQVSTDSTSKTRRRLDAVPQHDQPALGDAQARRRTGRSSARRRAQAQPGALFCCVDQDVCGNVRPLNSFISGGRELRSCTHAWNTRAPTTRSTVGPIPTKFGSDNLRDLYGVTAEECDARREAQDFRCAICRTHESALKGGPTGRPRKDGAANREPFRLVVDHCHSTGEVRGLLCHACNTGHHDTAFDEHDRTSQRRDPR